MSDTPTLTEVAAFYAGKRVVGDGQLADAWTLDLNKEPVLFKRAPAAVIGGVYLVKADVQEGQIHRISAAAPVWQRDSNVVADGVRAAWQAKDREAKDWRNRVLAEKRAAASDVLAELAEPVLALIRSGRTAADRRAMADRLRTLARVAEYGE